MEAVSIAGLGVIGVILCGIGFWNHVVADEVGSTRVRKIAEWIGLPSGLKQSCFKKLSVVKIGVNFVHATASLKRIRCNAPMLAGENQQFIFKFVASFGWLEALGENISLRFRLFRARRRLRKQLLRRRKLFREIYVLRTKVELLPNPAINLLDRAVVSTDPCPGDDYRASDYGSDGVPVVENPLHNASCGMTPNDIDEGS